MPRPASRVLWVKVGPLWPLDTGGRLRSFNMLAELSRTHRVSVLLTHGPDDDPGALPARLPYAHDVTSIPYAIPKRGSVRFAAALARSWPSRVPVDLAKFRIPALGAAVRRAFDSGDFDLCVADFLSATPNVPTGRDLPVVFFAHNVEHMIWKRLAEVESRPYLRPLLELEWRKMRAWEAAVCRRARLTVTVSKDDGAVFRSLAPGRAVHDVPTGVDTTYFSPAPGREVPGRLVFTGSMDWHPNADAALYFIAEILPRIRRQEPAASLALVGRNPGAPLRRAAEAAGVHVTGTVADVRPYVAEGQVCVVPLRVGGGTRLKIYEALAMGKPVVSTTIGAEGLPLVPGTHFIRVDEPDAFAAEVVALVRDPGRRAGLGAAGHALVEARYAWPEVTREFERLCEAALHPNGAPALHRRVEDPRCV